MNTYKKLGKISKATFGYGGYQDAMIGLSLQFYMDGTGCGTFYGDWGIERSEYCQWSEEDRIRQLGEAVWKLRGILDDARVKDVSELEGVPVEVTLEGNTFKDFRVLKEVL